MERLTQPRTRAEWLDLLMRCQNGEATCLYVLNAIENEHVPIDIVRQIHRQSQELCWEIENLPASSQQTTLSIMASNLSQELQKQVYWNLYREQNSVDALKKDLDALSTYCRGRPLPS